MTLELREVSYSIGANRIVDRVSGAVCRGEVVALVGPNGAGKSTLAAIVSGLARPDAGDVSADGVVLTGRSFNEVARLGIARMFQSQHLAWNLTASENVLVALRGWEDLTWGRALLSPSESEEAEVSACVLLERVGLSDKADALARELSFGQMRLLALARALAHPGDYLLLDEPFTGLKSSALGRVQEILVEERQNDRAVWLIDHVLSAIETTADRIWFMHKGSIIEFPRYENLTSSEVFTRHYLGGEWSAYRRNAGASPSSYVESSKEPLLHVRGLSGGYGNREIIDGVDLDLRPGEVIGVVGANGTGKSTLLRLIAGLAKQTGGSVSLAGKRIDGQPTHERIRMGLRFLPQEGRLLSTLTVADNERLSEEGLVRLRGSKRAAGRSPVDRERGSESDLSLRIAGSLSGGEQARLALRDLTFGGGKALLLDEPTSGVDAIAATVLQTWIRDRSSNKIAVIIVDHDIGFLLSASFLIYQLVNGHLVLLGQSASLTPAAVLARIAAGNRVSDCSG